MPSDGDDPPPDVEGFEIDATVFGDGVGAPMCGTTVLLSDDFSVAGPGPTFSQYTASGLTITEPSRWQLNFASNVGSDRYAGYKSATSFPTEGLCGTVELIAVPANMGLLFFKLTDGTQQVEFFLLNGRLNMRTHQNNQVATVFGMDFDMAQHRFWRIRQQNGVTYWDTSNDGVSYDAHASTTFLTGSTLFYEVGGGAFASVSNGGIGAFDNALVTGP